MLLQNFTFVSRTKETAVRKYETIFKSSLHISGVRIVTQYEFAQCQDWVKPVSNHEPTKRGNPELEKVKFEVILILKPNQVYMWGSQNKNPGVYSMSITHQADENLKKFIHANI